MPASVTVIYRISIDGDNSLNNIMDTDTLFAIALSFDKIYKIGFNWAHKYQSIGIGDVDGRSHLQKTSRVEEFELFFKTPVP